MDTIDELERMRFRAECGIIHALYSHEQPNEEEINWFDKYNQEIRMVKGELDILLHGIEESR